MGDSAGRREEVIPGINQCISEHNRRSIFVEKKHLSAQEKDKIYHQLIDMFVEVLEPNIIQDVIQNRNYDFYGALEDLMSLTTSVGNPKVEKSNFIPQKEAPMSPEKSSSSEEESSSSAPSSDEALVTPSESLDAIKVSYTGVDEENEDADVIIEEENEFVFLNNDELQPIGSSENSSTPEVTLMRDLKSFYSLLSNTKLNLNTDEGSVDSQSTENSSKREKPDPVVEHYQLIKKIPNAFDRIVMLIKENLKVMVLMRGCPGSGKSHLATTIMKKTLIEMGKFKDHILSSDDYFLIGKVYVFNPEKLSEAHSWNQRRVLEALRANRSPIIIDNTNTQIWEMRPYAAMAVAQGYDLEILEPETWWSFNERELTKRNIHNVPKKSIRNMLDRYEKNINAEKLFRYCGLNYSLSNSPPQLIPDLKPKNNIRKRGCRGGKRNKNISDVTTTSGLPDHIDISKLPTAPSQEFPTFEFKPDSNTFKQLCSYYKSLNFDKPEQNKDNLKTNENCEIPTNLKKESSKQKFDTEDELCNENYIFSFTSNFNDSASGYTPKKNKESVASNRQDIIEEKQLFSSKPFIVTEISKQPSCSVNTVKPLNDNKCFSFLGPQQLVLNKEGDGLRSGFDKLNLEDIPGDDRKLNEKLVEGEQKESEHSLDSSILNTVVYKKDIGNISAEKSNTKIQEGYANQTTSIESYPYTINSLIQTLTKKVLKKEVTELNSEFPTKTTDSGEHKINKCKQSISKDITDQQIIHDGIVSTEASRNERSGDLQNSDVDVNSCALNVNEIPGENKGNKITTHTVNTEDIHSEMEENMCRQFIMYSSEGFIYSDPTHNIEPVEKDCNNKIESVLLKVENSSALETKIINSTVITETSINSCVNNFNSTTAGDCEEYNVSGNLNFDNMNTSENVSDMFSKLGAAVAELNECKSSNSANLNHSSEVIEEVEHLKAFTTDETHDSICKIDNLCNNNSDERNDKVLTKVEDISESKSKIVNKAQDSFHDLSTSSNGAITLPVLETQIPRIDIMNLLLGNNFEEIKSSEIVNNSSPKPARVNCKQRIPTTSIFDYPITSVEILPEVALWDTVRDPHSLWNSSKENKPTASNEQSKIYSKPQREFAKQDKRVNLLEVTDSSTNTSYSDFDPNSTKSDSNNDKILLCKNRNICEGIGVNQTQTKSTVLLLDKGSMTMDVSDESRINFQELISLFPQVQEDALFELVEKCQGDLNWAIDLILESDQVNLPVGYKNSMTSINFNSNQPDKHQETNHFNVNLTGARKKIPRYDKKLVLNESTLELKELIEKNIVLDESHYSDHVLKIMKRRRDMNKKDESQQVNNSSLRPDKKTEDSNEESARMVTEQDATKGLPLSNEDYQNFHFTVNEKLEEATNRLPLPNQGEHNSSYNVENENQDEMEDDEEEDFVELAVGKDLIMQLQNKFGCLLLPETIDNSSLIELPVSLACQLHCYVMDSILRQIEQQQDIMDGMVKEDEEFARQLQEQDDSLQEQSEKKPTPLLQEIMDMEMALAFYKADQDEWRQQNQNTMAAKLSMQLLTQSYPKIDKNLLTEIFHANHCSLHDTVASINLAFSDDQPDLVRKEEELLAKLKTVKSQEPQKCVIEVKDPKSSSNPRQEALEEAEEYRKQATCYYQLRNDCFKKAQEAFRSGNTSVASYYSQLATLHKNRTEFFNSQAAACLFHARSRSSTLDLHFLRVAEAVEVLDIFLDKEISQLVQSKKKKCVVFLITGRGLRSVGGVSRIKPVVQRRLRERKITYSEINPGMLSAVLARNTQLTCNV